MKKNRILHILALAGLLLSALVPSTAALAAAKTWTVTKTADTNDGACTAANCSLRDAINAAQNGDSIVFAAGVTGTITLASSELFINNSITITGPGAASLSVSGNDKLQVFEINANVHISDLTITHGSGSDFGGGIYLDGVLSLDHVVVSDSKATAPIPAISTIGGGIYSDVGASLTITNSVITNNSATGQGGGLYISPGSSLSMTDTSVDHNQVTGANSAGVGNGGGLEIASPYSYTPGTITLNRVRITDNSAPLGEGGGLVLSTSASISNSLIANNSAADGGGLTVSDDGSGAPMTSTLTNVTISGNSATSTGGGVHNTFSSASDSVTLNNVTIANNHQTDAGGNGAGGVYVDGSHQNLEMENSILAGNSSVARPTAGDCIGTVHSLDYNLFQASWCVITGTATTHNLTGVSANLGGLADNGGSTQTMALLPGSPAIDAGNDNTCATKDQRGVTRPQGPHCDMGAYELAWYTITGNAGDAGVALHYTINGTAKTVTSGSNGHYTISVPSSWSGTVTPKKTGVTFSPAARNYTNVTANKTAQNYTDTVIFKTKGTSDGWILESAKGSGVGGSMNSTSPTFVLGDNASNRQYRTILSFNTTGLPDTASISKAVLKIDPSGSPTGTDLFSVLGTLYADIKTGFFGTSSGLQLTDFNAAPTASKVGAFGKNPTGGWYTATLLSAGRSNVNKTSLTQFRLYFSKATNANSQADLMKFLSGNSSSNPAQLIITYSLP